MPKRYRDSTGADELRPSTGELLQKHFARSAGGLALDVMTDDRRFISMVETLDASREQSRKLLSVAIQEIDARTDAWQDGDLATLGNASTTQLRDFHAMTRRESRELLNVEFPTVEHLLWELRFRMYFTLVHQVREWSIHSLNRNDALYGQLQSLLAHDRMHPRESPEALPVGVIVSGYGTAVARCWDTVFASLWTHLKQRERGIDEQTLLDILRHQPEVEQAYASLERNQIAGRVDPALRAGRAVPAGARFLREKDSDDSTPNPFVNPRSQWLAEDPTDGHPTVETKEEVFNRMIIIPSALKAVGCPGKGRAIQRIFERTAAVCKKYIIPNLPLINRRLKAEENL